MKTYYEDLCVTRDADGAVIEAAYRARMKRFHPDVFDGDAKIANDVTVRLNEAYRTLKNPESRRRYDLGLDNQETKAETEAAQSYSGADGYREPPASASGSPPPRESRPKGGGLTSAFFMVLAVLVIIRAISSISASFDKSEIASAGGVSAGESGAAVERSVADPDAGEVALVPPSLTYKTSFDCGRADSDVLKLVCGNEELADADRALSARYNEILGIVPFPAALRAEQRRWLEVRDASPATAADLLGLYRERLDELNEEGRGVGYSAPSNLENDSPEPPVG